MRLEAYALDFEDMILFALLHDVKKGFYIDAGANDPTINSVTRFFYDRGWSGINIEPLRSECRLLEEARPRDINLCIGLGAESGEKILYEIPALDILSSFSEEIAAERVVEMVRANPHLNRPDLSQHIRQQPTQIMTMTEIFRDYCAPSQQIHFCKIDVEGFEREVLLGVEDWEEFRPWFFCIESHEPTESRPEYNAWESILIGAGYQFMFDFGMNRFYVDSRKKHLSMTLTQVREFLKQFEIYSVDLKLMTITS